MASQDVCDEILAGYFPHIDDEYATYIKGKQIVGISLCIRFDNANEIRYNYNYNLNLIVTVSCGRVYFLFLFQ